AGAQVDDVADGDGAALAVGQLDHQAAVVVDVDGGALEERRAGVDADPAAEGGRAGPVGVEQPRPLVGRVEQPAVGGLQAVEEPVQQLGPVGGPPGEVVAGGQHVGQRGGDLLGPVDVDADAHDQRHPLAGGGAPVAAAG